jgi:hypothetical protein
LNEFNTALAEFSGTGPTKRHTIFKQKTSTKLSQIVAILNSQILPNHLEQCKTFNELHTALYCAAAAAVRSNGNSTKPRITINQHHRQDVPSWQRRLETRIQNIRKDLGRITQYINGTRTRKLIKHVGKITREKKVHGKHEIENVQLEEYKDTLYQKLSALVKRLRQQQKENGKISSS